MIPTAAVVRTGSASWAPSTSKKGRSPKLPKSPRVPSARWKKLKRDLKDLSWVYLLHLGGGLVNGLVCSGLDHSLTLLQGLAFGVGMFTVMFVIVSLPILLFKD